MGEVETGNLAVVTGSAIAAPRVSTERQMMADQVRQRVAHLRDAVAQSYFELGRHLHTIQKEALFKLWGFETFSEYIDKEVTFKWRKAMYLMKIYRYYGLELGDKEVFEAVKPLGISKAAALAEVVTQKNAEKWVEKAKALPVKALEDEVRLAKKAAEERRKKRREAADERKRIEDAEAQADADARKGNALYSTGDQDDDAPEVDPGIHLETHQGGLPGIDIDPVGDDERKEVRQYLRVLLTDDQRKNIIAACQAASHFIDEGKRRTEKEKNHDANGYHLDFVATGFLAFHGTTVRENIRKHYANMRNDTLAAIERTFSIRLIAVAEGTTDVIYGDHHVAALMGEAEGEE